MLPGSVHVLRGDAAVNPAHLSARHRLSGWLCVCVFVCVPCDLESSVKCLLCALPCVCLRACLCVCVAGEFPTGPQEMLHVQCLLCFQFFPFPESVIYLDRLMTD